MKLLHYFITHDRIKRRFLVGSDYCIYCNATVQKLYYSLTEELRLESKEVHKYWQDNNLDYFKDDCKFYNEYTSCPNGITEEEFIIKGIIE
jgi:hypothetical protein